ncbi:MAG: polysaccharide biosynthesis protein [Flavobacteriaceae bacterium]|nr:polysaccharide biosynthesis protein [Candidatus Onthonaster equi]
MTTQTKKNLLKNLPRWVILLIDIIIVIFTYFACNFIINSFSNNFDLTKAIFKIPIITIIYFISFLTVGTYRGIVKETGIKDAQNVFLCNILAFCTLLIFSIIIRNTIQDKVAYLSYYRLSYSVLFIHSFVTTVIMVASRLLYKALYKYYIETNLKDKNVIVYGAGTAGKITYSAVNNDTSSNSKVLFFIDDDLKKSGTKINGINVYHSSILTKDFIVEKNIKEVIISIQNISRKKLLDITQKLGDLDIKIKTAPPVNAWLNSNYSFKQIKDLRIEDLLGRESIKLDNPLVNQELEGKVILVSGAAGSIGSEIARQVAKKNFKKLILVDIAESALYDVQQSIKTHAIDQIEFVIGNVRDKDRMKYIFHLHKPDYIYHAAAYKHVPLMEKYPFEAVNTNVKGTKIMADLAHEFGVEKFVMVSTDKAVNPTNVMGATKRCAELYVNCLNAISETNFIVTRFGNVLGSNGSVIPLFKRQMEEGGPLTVTHKDITRFFMTIPEACQLVLEAGSMGKGGEIFVFDMGESMKIIDLAKRMISLSGYKYPDEMDIKIVGLRPGEKIFEELLANDENTVKTHHEKIMIAKVNYSQCNNTVALLNDLTNYSTINELSENKTELVKKIKSIVPEFKSQNSEYEILDA